MTAYEDLRDETLTVHAGLAGELTGRLAPTRSRLLDDSRGRLISGQFTVVVAGEFKRGKSSLLNALVERPGLFPVDADVATSAVTTLRWGPADSATVYFAEATPGDPASAPPLVVDPARAAEFVTEQGNPGNAKSVELIELTAPIPQLASGIVLVDTPGVGSINPSHTEATRAYLKYADAVVFVVSAAEPAGTLELDFLKVALEHCPTVVIAVTMIDRVVDPEPVVTETRSRVAHDCGRDPASLVIVAVSAHRQRDAIEDGDAEVLAESGFPRLAEEVWQGLTVTVGVARVNATLDVMYAALTEAAAPIANDLAALRGDAGKAEAELKEHQEKARLLRTDAHGWRRALNDDVKNAARPVMAQLDLDLDLLFERFREALGTPEAINDPESITRRAASAMMIAGENASHALEAAFGRIADKYTALTDLPVTISAVSSDSTALALPLRPPPKPEQVHTRFTTARQIWTGGVVTAGAGGLIGSLIVPGAGTIVGSVIGLVTGLFYARRDLKKLREERERKEYVAELRTTVLEKLNSGRRQLVRNIQDQVNDASVALTRALDDEITAKSDAISASVRAVEETARGGAKARAQRAEELAREQDSLGALRSALDKLRARANGLARRSPGTVSQGTP
jgi:gas vesicle protein/GTP-binding protein EngB required for normal cell division